MKVRSGQDTLVQQRIGKVIREVRLDYIHQVVPLDKARSHKFKGQVKRSD